MWRKLMMGAVALLLATGGVLTSKATPVHAMNGSEVLVIYDDLHSSTYEQVYGVWTFCVSGLNQNFVQTLGCFSVDRNANLPAAETYGGGCGCYYWWQGAVNVAGYDNNGTQITWNGGMWVSQTYSGYLNCLYDSGYIVNC